MENLEKEKIELQQNNSLEDVNNKNNDNLSEIEELRTLNVRTECQDVLEQQALNELEIFAEENSGTKRNSLVNDEIVQTTTKSKPQSGDTFLNLEEYIKQQQELKKRLEYKRSLQASEHSLTLAEYSQKRHKRKLCNDSRQVFSEDKRRKKRDDEAGCDDKSGSEYVPSEPEEYNTDTELGKTSENVNQNKKSHIERVIDDGCNKLFKTRLKQYYKQLEYDQNSSDSLENIDVLGLKVPARIWNNLYRYQQDGVEWLWKIHQEKSGGLLGDEMGLGKTVQVIGFLAALQNSRAYNSYVGLGPTLIVAPATVVHQWVKHFHEWAPEFRVAILHHSGSFSGGNKTHLVREINKCKGILITTYSGVLRYKGCINDYQWHYLILDEGHKIRNSNAKVTIAIKQIRTPHRLMLTGSPMQNNLQELWSLFDFIEPGMLGTLTTFMEHFNNPIIQGGYTNATPMQEATALSVATALKNLITPHLLRRTKTEVIDDIRLPTKSEQVLFCSLTDEQRDLYKSYLLSEHVSMILGRGGKNWFSEKQTRANVLMAITTLRKICNHPDLYLEETVANGGSAEEEGHGYYKNSGKMIVVGALLKIWKKQGHRVLLFTQGRAMISVFEAFLSQQDYKYLKMDGSTSVSARQPLINKFNSDEQYDVFLSTTRVGGLGVNLTGANRVIIYDPDWNPATDTQARERSWRIGQEKPVTVYRLISAGTIEEKMYQRQVWKQLLTNKVLIDPRTQKFFKTSDLYDLFSLPDQIDESNLETANIFKNSRVNLQQKIDKKRKQKRIKTPSTPAFSDEKLQAMKNLAQQIAKSILPNSTSDNVEIQKTSFQKELEEERLKKLKEKESLKSLTALELLHINRKKAEPQIQAPINIIDDSETITNFSNALKHSEKNSKIYNILKTKKFKGNSIVDKSQIHKNNSRNEKNSKDKKHNNKKKMKADVIVDDSGEVDGQHVEGLLKTEFKRKEKPKNSVSSADQDQYVLKKLFAKKGVHSALQHDVIVQGHTGNNIKIHYEAQQRTDLALQALQKSRLEAWRY